MQLRTTRLIIRSFLEADVPALQQLAVDKEASPMAIYDQAFPTDEPAILEITKWFASGDQFYAVCLIDSLELIGFVTLNHQQKTTERNLGYCLHSKLHGHGYATEMCGAILYYAFNLLDVERLVAGTGNVNIASVKLLERLGFTKIGESVIAFRKNEAGEPLEFIGGEYVLSKEDYQRKEDALTKPI
ncbi:MAG TPA: GNAT family N-acetyltransferase [Bacillota bacterium]|nr:GNAT family N-acetyltransferase [Bacillota bacterium]